MIHAKTILIVDDEPRTRQGLKKTLENWADGKFQILSAADGEEAIGLIQQHKINLLITDIRMPKITGLKLLETIKKQSKNPVVIVISAYSEFEYAQEALRLGVVNYLVKPIGKQKLVEAVEQALQVEEKQEKTVIMEKVVDNKLTGVHANLIGGQSDDRNTRSSIRDAMHYVDQNFKKDISLKGVANHVHLNSSYFSALFKEQTGLTFSEYLTRSRIQHAKNLLVTGDLPIVDISEAVGYNTSKYFIKLFKQYEGQTPSAYRKNYANDF